MNRVLVDTWAWYALADADCPSFAVMRALGLTRAFSADRHLAGLGFELVPRGSHTGRTIELMRRSPEDKVVTTSRAHDTLTLAANLVLMAAMNPCPCGHFGDSAHECTYSLSTVSRYQRRISGPLLDRIDIHVDVPTSDTWLFWHNWHTGSSVIPRPMRRTNLGQ